MENYKIFKFLKIIFLDTFISEENNGVLYFFKKTRENLLFCHTNKVVFIKSKKNIPSNVLSNLHLFLSPEPPILWMHYVNVTTKAFRRLFCVMWFWGIT